jgi:hypothetical protein
MRSNATGKAKAPIKFADPALHLTVISSMWQEEILPEFDNTKFFGDDKEFETEDFDERVMKAILATPIATKLPKLKFLQWDGGDEIWFKIWQLYDGEDTCFDVKDLSGIEQCPNLERIWFNGDTANLKPLAKLKKLRDFDIGGPLTHSDIRPLVELPALKRVKMAIADNAINKKTLKELKAKGVKVEAL